MHRKGRKISSSSPEEHSRSSSSEHADSSTSQKQVVSKKAKTTSRTVSTLTDEQLDRKRSNDREAQRKIRQKNKEKFEHYEAELAHKDRVIAHLHTENQSYRDYHGHQRDTEARQVGTDTQRQSVASDSSEFMSHKQAKRVIPLRHPGQRDWSISSALDH